MDTKLKNYDGVKKLGCLISGVLFIAATTILMEKVCRIFWLYDFERFLRWGPLELELPQLSESELEVIHLMLSDVWKGALVYGAAALTTLILAVWLTGKQLNWFDRIFTEIQVVLMALAVVGLAGVACIDLDCMTRKSWYDDLMQTLGFTAKEKMSLNSMYGHSAAFEPQWLETFFAYSGAAVLIGVCLLIFLSWVKKIKGKAFWRTTLAGSLILAVADAIRNSKGVQGKLILILLIGALLSATWIGLIAVLVFIIFYVPRQVKKYIAIRDGVEEVKNGNVDCKIVTLNPGEKPGELDRLAEDINAISKATSVAVANELKNQRLKTDLISNVSHDLKTPLTSMVSYVDLLKREGLDSEHGEEYLAIIEEKTKRLQKLTEDLFEAAKASSGAIPVNMERIEMTSMVNQSLAEVEERLAANQLEVIFTDKTEAVPGEGCFVQADGQLLWRVMENLLVNVSKYAMTGSRVYMDLTDDGEWVRLELKNISKERLNINADELMERFKRGDESRNTEGSGLGLAIAKDLVKLMEGEFFLTIDGDLFKAAVMLRKA